jgi:hypothetical protein
LFKGANRAGQLHRQLCSDQCCACAASWDAPVKYQTWDVPANAVVCDLVIVFQDYFHETDARIWLLELDFSE